MRTEQGRSPGKPGGPRFIGSVPTQGFGAKWPAPFTGAPGRFRKIRAAAMAEVHKSGSKEPFLWNRAATAAGRNRKAAASVDSILPAFRRKSKLSAGAKCGKSGRNFRKTAGKTPEVRGNAHIQAKKSGFSGLTGHVTMIVMMEQHDHLPRIPPGGGPRKERDTSAPFRRGGFCKEVPSVGTRTARRTAR